MNRLMHVGDLASMLKIRCSICNKRVDRIGVERDLYHDVVRIKVLCHGERDTMTLTMAEIEQNILDAIAGQEGVAFAPKIVVSGDADYSTEQQLIRGN